MKNLRKVLLMIACAWGLGNLNAQVEIGLKSGANFARVSSNSFLDLIGTDFQMSPGFTGGVFAEIGMGNGFSFQPEINYIQKGFAIREGVDIRIFNLDIPISGSFTTQIHQIDMPLLLKYSVGNEKFRAYVEAGPVAGYAMGGRAIARANVIIPVKLYDQAINLDNVYYNRFEIAGRVGAGIAAKAGIGTFHLGAAYQHGFNEVYTLPIIDARIRNRGVMATIGYSIPIF